MSSQLVWQIIRKHTCFVRTGLQGEKFTTEAGNLAGKHSLKHSGLANSNAIDLQAGEGQTLVLTKKTKHAQQPTKAKKTVELKKRHTRQLKAIEKEVGHIRSDLKSAALRRASALHKAQLRAAASKSS